MAETWEAQTIHSSTLRCCFTASALDLPGAQGAAGAGHLPWPHAEVRPACFMPLRHQSIAACTYQLSWQKPGCQNGPPLPRFRYKGEATKLRNLSQLRHVDPYQVSISPDGTEVVISLCRSATLDAQYLVSIQLDGLLSAAGVCLSMFWQQLTSLQST